MIPLWNSKRWLQVKKLIMRCRVNVSTLVVITAAYRTRLLVPSAFVHEPPCR